MVEHRPIDSLSDLQLDDIAEVQDLGEFDLNLLVVLAALLRRRNITHAGQDVRLSQPAASRALTRLRAIYDDELLVKANRAFDRTPLAEALFPKVTSALGDIDGILDRTPLAPERFILAMPDHQALLLSGHLVNYFREVAPGTVFLPLTRLSNALPQLESGKIDLILGNMADAPPGFFRRALPPAPVLGLCHPEHPAAAGRLSHADLGRFLSVRIGSNTQTGFGDVHDGLEDLRPRSRETLTVPDIQTAAQLLLGTNAILMLPARAARYLADRYGLVTFTTKSPPTTGYQISLLWHERNHRDVIHAGVRSMMASLMIEGG
ncbi:LysR substrate-binding domain-containing protein [Falsirhodobacter sp. 20TX0035]|uniref:LysR substrate-binding domain-containing protein n=1 Tax=Falsirhodobacter sp. 20TX0035 TaxID=3022019 RepID=UPI00232B0328|nr:LysR family transcriptional regulator [Falsirhodobacter sp. 20TX0035]MDB6453079.1 LysR substrate-binding domain-containing protein [Falsirhodobacter sp. 20TX0035]